MRYFLGFSLHIFTFVIFAQHDTIVVEEEPLVIHKEVYFAKPPIEKQLLIGIEFGAPMLSFEQNNGLSTSEIGGSNINIGIELEMNNWHQSLSLGAMGTTGSKGLSYNTIQSEDYVSSTLHTVYNYDTVQTVSVEYDTVYGGIYGEETKTIFIDSTITNTIFVTDSNFTLYDTTQQSISSLKRVRYYSFKYHLGKSVELGKTLIQVGLDLSPSLRVEDAKHEFRVSYGLDLYLARIILNDKMKIGVSFNYLKFSSSPRFPIQAAAYSGIFLNYFLK